MCLATCCCCCFIGVCTFTFGQFRASVSEAGRALCWALDCLAQCASCLRSAATIIQGTLFPFNRNAVYKLTLTWTLVTRCVQWGLFVLSRLLELKFNMARLYLLNYSIFYTFFLSGDNSSPCICNSTYDTICNQYTEAYTAFPLELFTVCGTVCVGSMQVLCRLMLGT